jgi:hypothetical protein
MLSELSRPNSACVFPHTRIPLPSPRVYRVYRYPRRSRRSRNHP